MAQSHDKYMLWEEISIDIDWGIIKGKVCGVGARKILGIHGWLDNANTFDLIAPYIKNDATFLTIDLPGHGLSSHFPPGFFYDIKSLVASIKKVTSKLQWRNFTFLTHSIGAIVGIVYSAVFPEDVNTFISIDIIKPKSYQPKDWAPNLRNYFNNYFKNEMLSLETPLEYSEEELISKTIEGSNCSLDVESAKILLIRSSRPSGCGTKRILTRDLRAKVNFVGFFPFDVWKEYASAIKCCILIIKVSFYIKYNWLINLFLISIDFIFFFKANFVYYI